MGEIISTTGVSEASILSVINPPLNERNRDSLVAISSTTLPPQAVWRMSNPVGKKIPNGVVSNHFLVEFMINYYIFIIVNYLILFNYYNYY